MTSREKVRSLGAMLLASTLVCPPAQALVSLNDGRDRIYVTGSVTAAHDSNIFASADSEGDFVYSTSLVAEYTRRAGWIGVNASASVSGSKFASIDSLDFANPSFGLELVKQSGRTTGSFTLNAQRASRADAAVNSRVEYWNYNAGLGLKYPISGTFSLASNLAYSNTLYTGDNADAFSDLESYTMGLDLFHVYTSDRDLIGGYRYRHGETSRSSAFTDHSFTAGISGKVVRGVKGTFRLGYQIRQPEDAAAATNDSFHSWTSNGSLTYAFGKRTNLSLSVAKDFSTTATESFVDSLTLGLDLQHAFTSRFGLIANTAYGDSRFLGNGGRLIIDAGPPPVLGPERRDSYFSWSIGLNYSLNEHLKLSATYSWFRNWSTSSFADFVRSGYNLTVSSRW